MTMVVSGNITSGEDSLPGGLIYASSPGIIEAINTNLAQGRIFTDEEDKASVKLAVLGSNAAEKLFGNAESALGQNIQARSTSFEVIGVLKKIEGLSSFGGVDQNSLVIIPIRTGWEITNTRLVSEMFIQAEDSENTDQIKEKVEKVLLDNHNGEKDFSVLTQEDLLETVGGILDIITAMLSAIASISLLGGGIGIMNIMLVSVSERTREIGIRKAVGATQGAILLQFLIESMILTLIAGIVAVTLFSAVVSVIPEDSPIPISLEPSVLLLALGFSAVVGIIFGIIPAIGASRKNPIDALRYE
jgi:putative ABC transport system permease protein